MPRGVRIYRQQTLNEGIAFYDDCVYAIPQLEPDQILFAIVNKIHPSKLELARIINPLFPPDKKGLPTHDAVRVTTQRIRVFNGEQKYNQEIVCIPQPWRTKQGKQGHGYLMDLAWGTKARKALEVLRNLIGGMQKKERRLEDKERNGARVKRDADNLMQFIEDAIKRGKGFRGGAGARRRRRRP